MSIVAWPTAARVKRIEWALDQPAQVNRSEFTSKRQVTILPRAPRWSAKVELVPLIGQDASLTWQAFLVDLQGPVNGFRLPAIEAPQFGSAIAPVVNGSGQSGYSLAIRSAGAGTMFKRGHKIVIADQMVMVMAEVTANGSGQATLSVKPAIRTLLTDGMTIEAVNPACLVSLVGTSAGWSVDPGRIYGITLDVAEA